MKKQQKMAINYKYNYPEVAREAGFQLRQYKDGPLDWRLMGSLEVERILREQSLEQIDAVLAHLSEAPIGSMLETNILDSGIAKYFILSQFSIQYLIFCRTFLDETVTELRESHASSQLEVARLKKALTEANNEILQLHKRLTQTEALHEVVFPCYLCTKNFVSNEALNIHISRKHCGKVGSSDGERCKNATPQALPSTYPREKENDLNLINTIKLELEIKQLKERLNQAEREIRERSAGNSKRPTPRQQEQERDRTTKASKRSVGIQSNLIEAKEQDESDNDVKNERERNAQLAVMKQQILNFEEWRETVNANNKTSIAEINRKLVDIAEALEQAKSVGESHIIEAKGKETAEDVGVQRRIAPSVEDLERLLSEKVLEIGKASAMKLEEVVYQMERNYREKLEELEREIKASKVEKQQMQEHNSKISQIKTSEDVYKKVSRSSDTDEEQSEERPKRAVASNKQKQSKPDAKHRGNNDTYEIKEDFPKKIFDKHKNGNVETVVNKNLAKFVSQSTDSNRTFVKSADAKTPPKEQQHESTDISESLSEDGTTQLDDDSEIGKHAIALVQEHTKGKILEKKEIENRKETLASPPEIENPNRAVQFTRKDAKKLVNKKLCAFGVDLQTKTLSSAATKRTSAKLTEQRNILKQKYANFYAARNKIKKFVDKLCSAKLPASAEFMLNSTIILQPAEVPQLQRHQNEESSLMERSFDAEEPQASTPREEHLSPVLSSPTDVFKQRLERILASPMHRPSADIPQKLTVDVHTRSKAVPGPVPLPRKRVMFNTHGSGSDSDAQKNIL